MSTGLCSVLESIRRSLDSDTDSDNDHDVTDDVDPPSWHGSLHQLTNTPSTSESEAGNNSSESFMCDHCGRANKGENNHHSASGRPPFPGGRKKGCRPKKRAHFAVDTDNSSDADKLSDSHESCVSSTFKPIPGHAQLVLSPSRRGSLSPREIKPITPTDNRHAPSFTRPAPSTDVNRGRQPFKANHELFKLPPSGSSVSTSSSAHKNNQRAASSNVTSSGKPALPPRQIHRNHFKLQRRNSVSNDERKLPVQTVSGKPDRTALVRPIRSASATREVERSSSEFQQLENDSQSRTRFSTASENVLPNSSMTNSEHPSNFRELPNYDEAVQRVSLLRWASLQKLPNKSTGENQLSPSHKSPPSQPKESGFVGERVRHFEEKVISFSSSGSSVAHDRANSWNPSNSDWFENNVDSVGKDSERAVLDIPEIDTSKACFRNNDDAIYRRRDNSSTLSDDVFANDDSRENFADISWSPVIPEDKVVDKSVFHLTPPKLGHGFSPSSPTVPRGRLESKNRNFERRDHNGNAAIRHSISNNDAGINDNNDNNNNNTNNKDFPGDNNAATLPNGKRIVLEVLV